MRALVIYESMFGNTEAIARAVGEGIAGTIPTEVVEVGVADQQVPDDIGLLVIGGPTHAFGMSRASTRRDAAERTTSGVISNRYGLREWLQQLSRPRAEVDAAAFDTKAHSPRMPGSAARAAERRLRHVGCRIVADAMTFDVAGMTGPLVEGELERARRWGEEVAAEYATRHHASGRG